MRDPVISIFHHKHGTSVAIVQEESSAAFWEKHDNHDRNNTDEYIEDVPLPPLFAAASAMLAALKAVIEAKLLPAMTSLPRTGRTAIGDLSAQVRAAIAKAEGQEPRPAMFTAQDHLQNNRDIWGRPYPDGFELCPVCGQPDNCGDCNHERCTDAQYFEMIGA